MEVLLGAAGAVLIVAATVDSLWTTLWTDGGAGPLAGRVSGLLWALLLGLPGREPHPARRFAGPVLLLAAIGVWVAVLVGGWWLVFLSADGAVVAATTRAPADVLDRLYYVGFGLFTLGVGDYVPSGHGWQLATVMMTGQGLFLVTLSITYLVEVLSAVVDKRAFANAVAAMGSSPEEIVVTAWGGDGFPALAQQLVQLTTALGRLSEQHLAYPVLHHYHTPDPQKAGTLAVAVLDEALTLLAAGVAPAARPAPVALVPARRTVATFLGTVPLALPDESSEPPPPADLDVLRRAGLPTVDDDAFAADLAPLAERRRRLRALVVDDAWGWPGQR